MEQIQKETAIIRELEKYSTSTIAICMQRGKDYQKRAQLFDSRKDKWYTDASLRVQSPEFGPRAGYAVTMRVGLPVEGYVPPTRAELLKLIDASPKPVVLVMQVDEPEAMRLSDSNFGGQFGYLCKQLGMESLVSDGAIRDIKELQDFGIQLMIPGSIAATAPSVIYELNGTVNVAGMEVSAGDIVHMDLDGAVKMPREAAEQVLACAKVLEEEETASYERIDKAQTLDDYLQVFYDMGYGLNKKKDDEQ